ncbi:MAG: ATP-binding protein [Paludibacteraceae bacterium]|nr:ATP-binding protein [Paludibacteraceae bacterium]
MKKETLECIELLKSRLDLVEVCEDNEDTFKGMDMISAMCQVDKLLENSSLSKGFFEVAEKPLRFISMKMNLTMRQSAVFVLFASECFSSYISIDTIADKCGCSTIALLRYLNDIDELENRGIIGRCEERYCCTRTYRVSQKTINELCGDVLSDNELESDEKNIIKHEEIIGKELFYDTEIDSRIKKLRRLLDREQYRIVHQRMQEKGFHCGFTCLFYGDPGTGKTETVLQLAKRTGRDILQVNISQIKSMWVGESENNIKQVFDDYRRKVKDSDITPILLFNEADAIIGKRQEGAERAVDKMENSIQNIILQEMESFDGILIATTNLVQNMDKAFERRFLYKVKFEKPTVEARMSIWQNMLPMLDESDIRILATRYDFSGGQIENIARHHTIDGILNGEDSTSFDSLVQHCENEWLEKKRSTCIGFAI